MTEFEFLAVLISILFGLGLARVCNGLFQYAYRRQLTEEQLLYSGFVFFLQVLDWWLFFGWRDHQGWTFGLYLLLVLWALTYYAMAVALYPPDHAAKPTFATHHRWVLWSLIAAAFVDIAHTEQQTSISNFETGIYAPTNTRL